MELMLALAVIFGFFYLWYAILISRRNKAQEALSGIDVQMKQRLDLIPNILKIAQRFLEHEKSLLTDITQLRQQSEKLYNPANKQEVQEHLNTVSKLGGKMDQLMIQVENYPDLKSDQTMVQAMRTYNEAEAQIAAARRFYNAAVTSLNNAIQIFPGSLIANMASVQSMPFFEAETAVHQPVDAGQYLK